MIKTLRTVLGYIRRHVLLAVLSIVLALASSLTALSVPVIMGEAIDVCAGVVSDGTALGEVMSSLTVILGKGLIIVAITAIMQWLMSIINNKITYEVVRDIRQDVFSKLQRVPLKYLDAHPTGELVSRMIADIDTLSDGLLMGFTQGFTGIVTIFGTIYYMWTMSKTTTMVVVCVTPLSLFVANFIAKKTHSMFTLQSSIRGEQTGLINEMIGNEKVVKSFGYEDEACERFDEINDRLAGCSLNAVFFSSLVNPSTRFVNSIVYAIVALVGAYRVMGGFISVGHLTALLNYATQYTKPFNEVSSVVTELQNAISCASRVFELLDEDEETGIRIDGEDLADSASASEPVRGEISIESVDFSYTDDKPLIENFSIDVMSGQMVAIVGPTGCGKTTLINLLMRFYDTRAGRITIDGRDITSVSRQETRSLLGMVLQETWIKSGSVLDNIRIGRPDASREEAVQAAKDAHADSFIRRLPDGYDTVLSENGGELSAGQRQLLCIARVMLALPPVLILDEATSNIDTRTELKIQRAFHKMMEGRTTFIVAHRLSTIMDADVIIVMKDGHIIEIGNHEELLKKKGFYSELFGAQFVS